MALLGFREISYNFALIVVIKNPFMDSFGASAMLLAKH